jgi:DNA-binding transcriptional ArsR family regulator
MPKSSKVISKKRATVIKALAHPSRLLIAEALMDGEMCVCDLKDLVGADMSTVSKHLSLMREAGVLISEKRGLNIYYQLACECLGDFLRCVDQIAPAKTKKKSCC